VRASSGHGTLPVCFVGEPERRRSVGVLVIAGLHLGRQVEAGVCDAETKRFSIALRLQNVEKYLDASAFGLVRGWLLDRFPVPTHPPQSVRKPLR